MTLVPHFNGTLMISVIEYGCNVDLLILLTFEESSMYFCILPFFLLQASVSIYKFANNRTIKHINMMEVKNGEIVMNNELRRIVEQAKENGTYEQLMFAVREYQQSHTAGIPNCCILTKDKERILRGILEYGLYQ